MTALILGTLAGWLVLRATGFRLRYPWRVLDLSSPAVTAPDPAPRLGSGRARRPRDQPGGASSSRRASTGNRSSVKDSSLHRRAEERKIEAALPAAVDLLRVAVSAGHSLHGAIAAVAEGGTGPVCEEFARASARFDNGASLVDELSNMPLRLGRCARPLSTTLVVAMSSGAPLAGTLQRLADSERRRLRRRTEERVRRLPLLLLAPLIGLVLPAFVILTVVPVVIATANTALSPEAAVATVSPPELPGPDAEYRSGPRTEYRRRSSLSTPKTT